MGYTEEQLEPHIAIIMSQSWTSTQSCPAKVPHVAVHTMPPMGHTALENRHFKLGA